MGEKLKVFPDNIINEGDVINDTEVEGQFSGSL